MKQEISNLKNYESRLRNIGIVNCFDEKTGINWRSPRPFLVSNIPFIWDFLIETVLDWSYKATPFQKNIDSSNSEDKKKYYMIQAFQNLQTYYLKCIFSYVMFFESLENSYILLYKDLKQISRELKLKIKTGRKPKRGNYIEKVITIRNLSIVHMGDEKGKHGKATRIAARTWSPLTLSMSKKDSWDLNRIAFHSGKTKICNPKGKIIEESIDLEIKGILELHKYCSKYLNEFDLLCAELLKKILDSLPKKLGNTVYSIFK